MAAVAGMLGIGPPETIRTWIRRQQVGASDRPGVTTDGHAPTSRAEFHSVFPPRDRELAPYWAYTVSRVTLRT